MCCKFDELLSGAKNIKIQIKLYSFNYIFSFYKFNGFTHLILSLFANIRVKSKGKQVSNYTNFYIHE